MEEDSSARRESVLVVSNRLPVTVSRRKSGIAYKASAGGLATAMSGLSEYSAWVGWPGAQVRDDERAEVERELFESHRSIPVYLTPTQVNQFYNRFSNGVIWPLFHYLPEYTDFDLQGWNQYRKVNEIFADVVASRVEPETLVWIHDYQLMLLPRLLRERIPGARIGFFLHIPFPSSEVYRLLPVRGEILEGLLGADVVGFHTHDYARHFNSCCTRILGCDTEPQYVDVGGRRVRLSVNPIGIDVDHFRSLADDRATRRELKKLRKRYEGFRVILGVDRLDYTKGLKYKLDAFGRFLERYPELAHRCVLLQVAVPSRTGVRRYGQLRREIEELVGHINGLHSSVDHTPVQFLFQSVSPTTLSALYQLADVCWVSPIRDGMNLVCQEFVISRRDGDGVLLLSEFAGAAHALQGATQVNPWNLDGMAKALHEGLEMPQRDRQTRLEQMQSAVAANSAAFWARSFVDTLGRHCTARDRTKRTEERKEALSGVWKRAPRRFLLLDLAAVVRSLGSDRETADIPAELRRVLGLLAASPATMVYLLTDLSPEEIGAPADDLSVALCAQRGHMLRAPGRDDWEELVEVPEGWSSAVLPIMETFADTTPGAEVEKRGVSLQWNWQRCDPGFGRWRANELAAHLRETMANAPVEVIHGQQVVQVRPQGVSQAALARHLKSQWTAEDCVLAIGGEGTDDEFFSELPESAWTCRIGEELRNADILVKDGKALLEGLERLASSTGGNGTDEKTTDVSSDETNLASQPSV